ncbi:MAG: beta-lactamase family protein [Intrasporangium sp.]|uniref:serine hydrolase domain-containing protein n=1 Tax=Intrasporangium sp. TaxID=1925024 RepID=UPI0026479321|nr:serine hydrolase domain-containing protein [Intrasporangium sp.]MDN5795658.1 beta-lactamase family protein [Intrasporangium sp.]
MPTDRLTDQQRDRLREVLAPVRGVSLDLDALARYDLHPRRLDDVVTSHGLDEGRLDFRRPVWPVPYHLDVARFTQGLHDALKDRVVGYSMELRRHGMSIAAQNYGWAKTPPDGGQPWTTGVRMHVASVSKLITAIAMTKVLAAHGISPDAKMTGYLPGYWNKGPHVGEITFRQLMTHRSGFDVPGSASDFGTMKSQVASGVAATGGYHYENMNFGLCRLLIATITGAVPVDARFVIPFLPEDLIWDYVATTAYAQFVGWHVWEAACVTGPTLTHPSEDALAYDFPVGSGWNSGDLTSMAGGAGWHASVRDLLAVLNDFRRVGTILTAAQAQQMLDDGFGIDLTLSTAAGTLYNKNGLWRDGSGRSEQSLAYVLPEDMELVVLTNSTVGVADEFFRDVVTDVYLANLHPALDLPFPVEQAHDVHHPLPVGAR